MKAKEIRASAREALQGNWGVACIAGIIASLFGAAGGYPSFEFDMESDIPPIDLNNPVVNWEVLTPIIIGAVVGFAVGLVIALVLGSFVSIGYAQFNLDMVDVVKPRIRTLFSKWSQVGTAIKAYLLVFLHVFIGSCLFVIPGLIAAYKYSMVAHVIAENPGITAREALRRSKEIMKGNKWRLFCMHLSFIGWNLLVLITLGIAAIWVVPYEQAAVAAFYREIA